MTNGINGYNDTIGERIESVTDVNGIKTETYTDSFGKQTVNTYDSQEHLVKSVTGDADNELVTRYIYDGDNLIQVIYPEQYVLADDGWQGEAPENTYANANVGERYTYDDNGNILTYTNQYGEVTTNTYDADGNLTSTTKPNGTVFTFDEDGRAKKETYSNGLVRDFTYSTNQTVISGSNGITVTYNLNSFGEVAEYKLQNGENDKNYSYTYDSNENITTISLNGSLQQTFTYNSSNELVRVDDAVADKTVTYEYDYVGNITSVKTYTYTTGTLGTPLTTQNYTYNSQNQRTDLSYDANGNLTELNGFDFTWDGRRLQSAVGTNANISFTYNHNGIRTSKSINGITTYYVVDENNNVVKQYELENDAETNVIEFIYDSNNTPIYFTYNNATYYYEKNLQGDIVAILDENGNTVVEYTYDIWGKLASITGSLADTLGVVNPLRYRGYYYDTETGLYYLQSRYYSPDLMRFISQDEPHYSNEQGQPLGSNLYVYCLNNPVMGSDPSGYASYKVAIAVQSPVSLNSTVAFNLKTMSAGHTFVELYKNGKKMVARGFSSNSTRTVLVALSRFTVKGLIQDEGKSKRRSITIYYTINSKQYEKIYNYLYMKKVPKYNIVSYNCTTFAIGALETAGIRHGFKKHFWNMGKNVYISAGATFVFGGITFSLGGNLIGQGSIAVSAFILSFSLSYGYYPARLAYDIAHGVY